MTAATGSRAKRMIRKPMAAFQNPITVQGSVTANSTTGRGRPSRSRRATARRRRARSARDRQADGREEQGRPPDRQRGRGDQSSGRSVRHAWLACLSVRDMRRTFDIRPADVHAMISSGSMPCKSNPGDERGVTIEDSRRWREALWYVGPGAPRSARKRVAAARPRRSAGAGAVSARSAAAPRRWSMPAGCRPSEYRAHARAVHGRRVSVSGEIRLRHGRPGRGRSGRAARAAMVFALHPHQSLFDLPADAVVPVPDACAAAARGAGRQHGDRAQRGLGRRARSGRSHRRRRRRRGRRSGRLSVRAAAGRRGDARRYRSRARARSRARSGARFAAPDAAPGDCDLVFHASGTAAGLATALRLAGEEATVVELSWYGSGDVAGAARRRVPQPPAAAGVEPGRQGRAVAPPALDARPAARGGARAARRSRARCAARARGRVRGSAGAAARDLRRRREAVCQLIRYPDAITLDEEETARVRRRSLRPHHDRPFVPRRGVRPGAGAARRDLRGRRGVLRRELDENGIVVDIGRAHEVLKAVLAPLNYQQPRRRCRSSRASTPRPNS